jgi:signal transduction histidine kinase
MVDADPELITRTLENLIANGLHHARGAADIVVTLSPASGGRVTCEVRDRNEAIADADREAIFEAFQRGPSQSDHRGYGLGLSFCRIAVETHGGKLTVDANADGAGNCFTFDLPAG